LTNTLLFPNSEETMRTLPLIASRFRDLIIGFLLPTRVHPSANSRFWLLDSPRNGVPFEIGLLVSKDIDMHIITCQRSEKCRVHQVQRFIFLWIIEGIGS
jgi:hypothetical protein